jgi:hypothetical protein
MHLTGLLHKIFNKTAAFTDKRNHKTLLLAAATLCQNKHLSIATLGRNLKSKASVRTTSNEWIVYSVTGECRAQELITIGRLQLLLSAK